MLQYGFRKKHSTTLAVLDLVKNIKKANDDGCYALGVFLDFSKAFDTMDTEVI